MPHALGIDVGGTKIAAGLVDLDNGHALLRHRIPTRPERGGEAVLRDCLALARRLIVEAAPLGIVPSRLGVGLPELVDLAGTPRSAATIDWTGLNAHARLCEILPARIESDVRAAALAEARFGAGVARNSFLYVTLGTGISAALVLGGIPWTGASGLAGTVASTPLLAPRTPTDSPEPSLPLELFASGPAIAHRYRLLRPDSPLDTPDIVARATEGSDPDAVHIVHSAAEAVGAAIGHWVSTLDPGLVLLGGGLGLAPGAFARVVRATVPRFVWSPLLQQVPILPARLGGDAGLVGAALSILP